MAIRVKCALRYPIAENIFRWLTERVRIVLEIPSYKKDIIHKMGQVCLETQIALAIQFLSIADRKLEIIWRSEERSVGIGTG